MDMSELVSCPFNSSHMVSRKKLQYHIVKCQKTYTGSKVPCPYNASEFIEPENLMAHVSTCESAWERMTHALSFHEDYIKKKEMLEVPFSHPNQAQPTERWGLD